MSIEDNYRHNADELVQLANKASKIADKRTLLRLAEQWLDLADRARDIAKRHAQHNRPLVARTVGSDQAG
jgi:hypothetical protein